MKLNSFFVLCLMTSNGKELFLDQHTELTAAVTTISKNSTTLSSSKDKKVELQKYQTPRKIQLGNSLTKWNISKA